MNNKLTEQIILHILSNLGVLPATFIDQEATQSLFDKQFLLSEKLSFEVEDGEVLRKNIYGCQISVTDSKEFKMLLADCTQDNDLPEYCLLVQLKESPTFGIYLLFNQLVSDPPDPEAMIAVSADQKHWMPCSPYLQATFLAGMEQIRDLGFGWNKCSEYQDQYQQLLSFIKFHSKFYEVEDEGQEG
jgi:hypothetical protein